ncbi:MAG: FkbM family methyltransferase [Verrucomicrobiia bacterium]
MQESWRLIRRNWRGVRLAWAGRRRFVYRLSDGLGFVCLPECARSRELFLEADGDGIERRFAAGWLEPGDTAWDLGANLGVFTVCFARAVGGGGKVVAVEPGETARQGLETALKMLGLSQVTVLPDCIWDQSGQVQFVSMTGTADVSAWVKGMAMEGGGVATVTLDELHERFPVPALIKMDIEGAEPRALGGGSKLLASLDPPAWIVELYTTGLTRMGFGPGDLLRFFPASDYDLYAVNFSHPNPMSEIPVGVVRAIPRPWPERWPNHSNLFALPRRGRFAGRLARVRDLFPGG